ncbi:hypothetical protein HOY80DRAFT_1012799 [Tuber brumale]|nr:hypothetical protein HOY80DRAFT_1012799 [Tuber brumale]
MHLARLKANKEPRCRGSPPTSNLEDLKNQLVTRALTLHTITVKALADSRDRFIDPYNPFFNTLVYTLAVRRMLSAEHFSSATQGYPEFRHCGLVSRIYTYHTSHPPSAAMRMSLRTFNLGLRSATSHYTQKSTRKSTTDIATCGCSGGLASSITLDTLH